MRAIDLFCGAGGLSRGFHLAGIQTVAAVDDWGPAVATFHRNFPHTKVLHEDIREVHSTSFGQSGVDIDVVAGGPPCQGFSSAGARGVNDERNSLVSEFARVAIELAPRHVFFENVEGFLTLGHGRFMVHLLDPLVEAGYDVAIRKLNVGNYGVPQLRKRVIVIASRTRRPSAPPPTHTAWGAPGATNVQGRDLPHTISLMKAISGISNAPDHEPRWPKGIELERIRGLAPGQTMRDLPAELQHASYQRRANRRVADGMPTERRGGAPAGTRRLVGAEPSKAITSAATREFIHPIEDRALTLRECARIQTFPDDFEFVGSRSDRGTLIGNAIPPAFAEGVGKHLVGMDETNTPVLGGVVVELELTAALGMSPALARTLAMVQSRYGRANQLTLV